MPQIYLLEIYSVKGKKQRTSDGDGILGGGENKMITANNEKSDGS